MKYRELADVTAKVIAPVIGDYLKEFRDEIAALRKRVEHQSREIRLLQAQERGRRNGAPR